MAFDLKAYRDKNARWYGSDPLDKVAQDVYARVGSDYHKDMPYEDWAKSTGISKQIEDDAKEREKAATEARIQEELADRGAIGDIGSDLARAVTGTGKGLLQTFHGAMTAARQEDHDLARMFQSGVEGIDEFERTHSFLQDQPDRGFVGKAIHQGIESAVSSELRKAPGTVGGALTGMALGGPAGAFVGGVLGRGLAGGVGYGLAQYDDVMTRGFAQGEKEGLTKEESRAKYEPTAVREGAYEGGFEFLGDLLEGFTMGAGKLITVPGKQAAKVAVKDLFQESFGKTAKRILGTASIEAGSEMATAGMQAEEERAIGLGDQRFWMAAGDAFGPAFVAGLIFGGYHQAGKKYAHKLIARDLEKPETDPEERAKSANTIFAALKEFDPVVAETWRKSAYDAISNKLPISTNEDILELHARIMEKRKAGEDTSADEKKLQSLWAKEHEKDVPTSQEDLDFERQHMEKVRQILGPEDERRAPVEARIGQLEAAQEEEWDYQDRWARTKQPGAEIKPQDSTYSPELAEGLQPGLKRLPPGQGFEVRASEDVYAPYSPELSEQASTKTKRLPPGQGFEVRGEPEDVAARYSPEFASAAKKPEKALPEGQGFELQEGETVQQKIEQFDNRIKNLTQQATLIGKQISKVSHPEKSEKLQTRLQELNAQIEQNRARKSVFESMTQGEKPPPLGYTPADVSAEAIETEAQKQESDIGREAGRIKSPVGKEGLKARMAQVEKEAEAAKMVSGAKVPLPPRTEGGKPLLSRDITRPPIPARTAREIDEAANLAATSPKNELPQPTEAQKEAGNYQKGHVTLQGMDISIENPKGSERKGVSPEGKPWSAKMNQHYGYIKGTKGYDKDHLDTFIGEDVESPDVYVVDQVDPKTGKFDEHKVMMGFKDEASAREAYLSHYEKGWTGLKAVTRMPVEEFKAWSKSDAPKKGALAKEAAPPPSKPPREIEEPTAPVKGQAGSELGGAMQTIKAIKAAHVTRHPSGKYGFVGSVDARLYYEKEDGTEITEEELRKLAHSGSPALTMRSLGVVSRVWDSMEEAEKAAKDLKIPYYKDNVLQAPSGKWSEAIDDAKKNLGREAKDEPKSTLVPPETKTAGGVEFTVQPLVKKEPSPSRPPASAAPEAKTEEKDETPIIQTASQGQISIDIRERLLANVKTWLVERDDGDDSGLLATLEKYGNEAMGQIVNERMGQGKGVSDSERDYINNFDKKKFAQTVLNYARRKGLLRKIGEPIEPDIPLGKNDEGEAVGVDGKGNRYFINDRGVRVSAPVPVRPTRGAGVSAEPKTLATLNSEGRKEFFTTEELDAWSIIEDLNRELDRGAGINSPTANRLKIDIGQALVPGVRNQDAEDVYSKYMLYATGSMTGKEWQAYVKSLHDEGRVRERQKTEPAKAPQPEQIREGRIEIGDHVQPKEGSGLVKSAGGRVTHVLRHQPDGIDRIQTENTGNRHYKETDFEKVEAQKVPETPKTETPASQDAIRPDATLAEIQAQVPGLHKMTVQTKAIREKTGEVVTVPAQADVAIGELDATIAQYKDLLECVGR